MSEAIRIGVVLSSGGVRGVYAHTGFLQGLEALGIPMSAIAGCSAGALVGGFIASGTPLQHWAEGLSDLKRQAFWTPDSLARFTWQMAVHKGRNYTGLSDTSAALQFCRQHLTATTFEECQYPFHALAINLGKGRKTVFSEGELAPRMVASSALPILYRPVEIDGEYYCDGALIDFAPTDAVCCRHNLDVVIVHHVAQHVGRRGDIGTALHDSWAMLEIINRLLFRERPWYLSDNRLALTRCPCACGAAVIAIEPELPDMRWPLTDGGDHVQRVAMEQTETLLRPYVSAILTNPRQDLPMPGEDEGEQSMGCGTE